MVLHPGPRKARGRMMSAERTAVSVSISLMKGFIVNKFEIRITYLEEKILSCLYLPLIVTLFMQMKLS